MKPARTLLPVLLLVLPLGAARAQFNLPRIPGIPEVPSLPAPGGGTVDPSRVVDGAAKVAKGTTGIGLQEELAIGESVSLEILSAYGGLWKDEAATRRANLIARTCGAASDRPLLLYRVGLLDSDAVNAFSAPGGWIFITRAAYQAAENDDQLAGILSHEIAHIARRHALRIIARNETFSGLVDVAAGTSGDFAAYDPGIDKISNTLLKFGYDAGTEFEADRVGAWTAHGAGYAQDGLLNFLQKLQASGDVTRETFSTHPDLSERIRRLAGTPPASPVSPTP